MKTFIKKYINNKYFYTGLAFVVWMTFFDQESFIDRYRLNRTLEGLENQKAFYLDEINKNEAAIYILENDTSQLERFAREKYYMKKDNEDVFVIVREEK
jgi:cell division protein FtsB